MTGMTEVPRKDLSAESNPILPGFHASLRFPWLYIYNVCVHGMVRRQNNS